MAQQEAAVRALVAHVAVWEVPPNVAQGRRTQQGIHQGVEDHIRIGVAEKPLFIGDRHTAQHQRPPLHQAVDVVALADSRRSSRRRSSSAASSMSSGVVILMFS